MTTDASTVSPSESGTGAPAPTRTKPATRADVAKRAGVSTALVSYVLTGAKPVAPASRERVLAAIAELEYRPNLTARALKTGRTNTIAVLIPSLQSAFYAEFASEFEAEAAARGCTLTLANSHEAGVDESTFVASFFDRGVDGVIIANPRQQAHELDPQLRSRPVLWIDTYDPSATARSMGTDSHRAARELVEHLITVHGHDQVAMVLGRSDRSSLDPRVDGWREAHAAHGKKPGRLEVTSWDMRGGHEGMRALLERGTPPTAVFAANDEIAIGVLRGAADAGLSVPTDLALVGFDGIAASRYMAPSITTYRQPLREMARAAIGYVVDGHVSPGHQEFAGEFQLGESCGCGR
ncbi:MAG TPA: LacI family DNA-binding transcriptional regulator [Candidatus Lumbricidophila sp.]|nr:LacI family DNA-binding transcriptional regulator [Candidatus Lumbricidophila sp.]